jgi:hypothetical protein
MVSVTANIKSGDKAHAGNVEKVVKFRLSKEQSQFVDSFVALDNRIVTCREYIALWMNFFRFFAEDLTDKEITPEEEKGFFQVSTQLARKHFTFVELMGGAFERGNDVINLLATAVSLSNIQAMQENTRSKLELDWHSLFLEMNKALGRLIRLLPGNMPLSEALASMDKISPMGAKPLAPGQAGSAKKAKPAHRKVVAALLALPPMGVLGLDCFYLGLTKKGILRIVTLGGLGLWCLIDFFRILAGKVEDAQGQTLG